jgi:microcystin-dependent protein
MTEPFMGEIQAVSFGFAPKGWAACNGQLLAINQNQALFSLLGTYFGGDGIQTFALPDLRGRAAMHLGGSHVHGERGGAASHTLTVAETAQHLHSVSANTTTDAISNTNVPTAGRSLGKSVVVNSKTGSVNADLYNTQPTDPTPLAPQSVSSIGGLPHENCQPYLGLVYIIALQGTFPSRN